MFQPVADNFAQDTASTGTGYGESSNGDTITVKLGDTIHLELPARIDQGYIWNLTVTKGLNITTELALAPSKISSLFSDSGLTSLEVTQEWDIQAVATGTQVILGSYKSSVDNGPYDRTYKLTVIVE
ncbi:MAG TPA: protease inhibitor I42 family protein [Methanocella sp.]|uniref:protease inhibitor I42 family protein n=1 Tax=Methanocella sp. TaxID=2052833 RepID=UPI002D04D582|nr:protease inhibitor I42 family protein [Methanocella sp.]HTY92004.1 protease inhibitor I42 family protein [Methanocella sp.]